MPDPEHKSLSLQAAEFKASEDGWQFTGYASTYGGEPDSYGDVIRKGAFDRSLTENPGPPLLWAHSMAHIVGVPVEIKSNSKGLLGTWQIVQHQTGQEAYANLKAGAVKGLSIGFYERDSDIDEKTGIRTLTDIELVEVSLVAVPANKNAQVSGVRSRLPTLDTDCKFADLFAQLAAYYQTIAAEAEALKQRRAEDERELSEAHVDALTKAIAEAEAFAERLSALRTSPQHKEAAEAATEHTREMTAKIRGGR